MAFGLNINFGGFVGNFVNGLKDIAASKLQNVSSLVKKSLINNATNALGVNIQSMVGTGLNLNLSKLTGNINFSNALKGAFPALGSLSIKSLYGLIDKNIGVNLNNFTKGLAKVYGELNLDEISLGNKLTSAIDGQLDAINNEIEAGIIAGKSSINVIGSISKLSNTQIRDFTLDPAKQLSYVNTLVKEQQGKIFNLSLNSIPESKIFENQISSLNLNSVDSFIDTTDTGFSFFDNKLVDEASISKDSVFDQQVKIASITETGNPLTRKIDLTNRFDKEEETLNYLEFLNDDLTETSEPISSRSISYTNLTAMKDPDTNEILGYTATEVTEDNVNDPSKRRRVILDHDGKFVQYR